MITNEMFLESVQEVGIEDTVVNRFSVENIKDEQLREYCEQFLRFYYEIENYLINIFGENKYNEYY